jgi:hypothetical protein
MQLNIPLIVALAGFAGIAARIPYPLLDSRRLDFLLLALFFVSCVPYLAQVSRKKWVLPAVVRKTCILAGVVFIVSSAVVFLNGALDQSSVQTRARVIGKHVYTGGRGGTSYSLDLTSWRQGRDKENVIVNRETFRAVQAGDSVIVGVHPGAFSLPWYSAVVPDEFDPRSE